MYREAIILDESVDHLDAPNLSLSLNTSALVISQTGERGFQGI